MLRLRKSATGPPSRCVCVVALPSSRSAPRARRPEHAGQARRHARRLSHSQPAGIDAHSITARARAQAARTRHDTTRERHPSPLQHPCSAAVAQTPAGTAPEHQALVGPLRVQRGPSHTRQLHLPGHAHAREAVRAARLPAQALRLHPARGQSEKRPYERAAELAPGKKHRRRVRGSVARCACAAVLRGLRGQRVSGEAAVESPPMRRPDRPGRRAVACAHGPGTKTAHMPC